MKNNNTQFISLNKAWMNLIKLETQKRNSRIIAKYTYNLGLARKIIDSINKRNITRVLCIINAAIPMTAFPITNPIIIKVSNSIDKNKISRKINCIKMRFR